MIKECADRLVLRFQNIAETEGKIDSKQYVFTAIEKFLIIDVI